MHSYLWHNTFKTSSHYLNINFKDSLSLRIQKKLNIEVEDTYFGGGDDCSLCPMENRRQGVMWSWTANYREGSIEMEEDIFVMMLYIMGSRAS